VIESDRACEEMTAELSGLLTEQRQTIEELADLAASQSPLIVGADTDALLGLLSRRQKLIDRFTSLQPKIAGLLDQVEPKLATVDPALRERLRADIEVISVRLEQVMAVDEEDQRHLAVRRDEARKDISSNERARVARTAYRDVASGEARFTDRRG